jgi:hypothetical protein
MKAIPMRGRLIGKRIAGFLWAGPGKDWMKKENYFQLEHDKLVSAVLWTKAGAFWIRCTGTLCEIESKGPNGRVLGTTTLQLPNSRKR